jgi:hypothetical protein
VPIMIAAGIGALGSIAGGLLSSSAQNDQQQQNADLWNKYLAQYQGGQNNYLNYLNNYGNPVSQSFGSGSNNTNSTSTQNPFVTQQFQPLVNAATNTLQNRLSGPSALPAGFAANQVKSINKTFANVEQANTNRAAQFGLSGPQATAMNIPIEQQRASDIGSAQANLPLTERALSDQDLQTATSLASIFGRGQTTNSRSNNNFSNYGMNIGARPMAPMGAFTPPAPPQGGPAAPTANLLSGALPGFTSGLQQYFGRQAYNNSMNGGGSLDNSGSWYSGNGGGFGSGGASPSGGFAPTPQLNSMFGNMPSPTGSGGGFGSTP